MVSHGRRMRRAYALLVALGSASVALSACVAQPGTPGYIGPPGPTATLPTPVGKRVAVLVPLSGGNAELGRGLLRAARLSLQTADGAPFDERDTKGTPQGAAAAAKMAIAGGAGIIVGPLTSGETAAVAAVTGPLNIPVLAFTSDESQAMAEVWPMGITPAQQARALVTAAITDNRRGLGALIPQNAFGDALAAGLLAAARQLGLPAPVIVRFAGASLDAAVAELAKAGRGAIDAVIVGSTVDATSAALPAFARAGLAPDRVRLLGTALWSKDAASTGSLVGAWFVAPDAQALATFDQNYRAKYGIAPGDIAAIAFDAAGAARAITSQSGVNASLLLTPAGFVGADGAFTLQQGGKVGRTLAAFEIGKGVVQQRSVSLQLGPSNTGM